MIKPSKIEAFVQAMKETPASRKWGFNKLAQREDLVCFFDELKKQSLFSPKENPKPEQASSGGYYIPFWWALTYLEKAAKAAAKENNEAIISDIKTILSSVTEHSRQYDEEGITNYHTWHYFTKMLACMPAEQISLADIELIDFWLGCVFDTSLVVSEITKNLLPNWIKGERDQVEKLLVRLVSVLVKTEKVLEDKERLGVFWGKDRPYVEMHWLNDFFKAHAAKLGADYGNIVVPILIKKLEDVLTENVNAYSYLRRPAIEDHQQNLHDNIFEFILISALRDMLTNLAEVHPLEAKEHINKLLESEQAILKRIGWHMVDVFFSHYKDLFTARLSSSLFETNNSWHEMYLLLQNNFSKLEANEKRTVFSAIQNIQVSSEKSEEERQRYKEHVERDWLSAIHGQDYAEVDARFNELLSKTELGGLRDHPEFISYHESFSGESPAPISAEEILACKHDKQKVIELFNNFEPDNGWRSPSYRSMADVLSLAVQKEPSFFLEDIDVFLGLKIPFLYGLVSGFKKVDLEKELSGWERALALCYKIVSVDTFWQNDNSEESPFDRPNKEWVLQAICDLVGRGVRDDETAFNPDLLPRAKEIILTILNRENPSEDFDINNAMDCAINTTRGRCLEILFYYALRSARVADKKIGSHERAWKDVQPVFDQEIEKCKDDNYDFSTLCGTYLLNLLYLSETWLTENIDKIFPEGYLNNRLCALQGFSYTRNYHEKIYNMVSRKVFLPALMRDQLKSETRKKLLQLTAISYLRGNEGLDEEEGVFTGVMREFRKTDISELAWFFYHLHDETMDEVQRKKVLAFWKACREKIQGNEEEYKKVLSNLGELIIYVSGTEEEELPLIDWVAPYVGENHNAPPFIEGLAKLVHTNSAAAGKNLLVLGKRKTYMYPEEAVRMILDVLSQQEKGLYSDVCNELKDYEWVMEHYREHKN